MHRSGLGAVLSIALVTAATGAIIDRVQITRAGIWSQGEASRLVFSHVTDIVPAKIGTIFGIEWRPMGRSADGAATLKIRWFYPPPGIQHPVTRVRRAIDEFDYPVAPGTREITVLELNSEAMLLTGKWVIEIGDATRTLARHEFTLSR